VDKVGRKADTSLQPWPLSLAAFPRRMGSRATLLVAVVVRRGRHAAEIVHLENGTRRRFVFALGR